MITSSRLHVKFDVDQKHLNPSLELLNKLVRDINHYLPGDNNISKPEIDNKYINFDFAQTSYYDSSSYITGMIAGYLMAKGFQIL